MAQINNAAIAKYIARENCAEVKLAADTSGSPLYGNIEFSISSIVLTAKDSILNHTLCLTSNLHNIYTIDNSGFTVKSPTPLALFTVDSNQVKNKKHTYQNSQTWFLCKENVSSVKFNLIDFEKTDAPNIPIEFSVHFLYRKIM